MKKKVNIRNLIIIMLVVTIILMSVGFGYLCIKLEQITNQKQKFDVSVTKIEKQTPVKGGTEEPNATQEIVNEGKTIKFNFELNNPNDELAYVITIKNTGTIPAKIIKIISTPDYVNDQIASSSIEPIEIVHEQVKNKTLAPGKEIKVKLVVSYKMSNNNIQKIIPYEFSVLATGAK